ncbi:hypothetical protein B0H13DRAFT_2548627 [Mycena leptocephala]|nr:hypothetical protein B0H13DRAFT_2548627 [Mycena leptocephala]
MAELPLELFQVISKDVEHDPSIFSLRLVSKTVNSVVTPLAFRVIIVNDSVKSAEAVSFLQGCDKSVTSLATRRRKAIRTIGEASRPTLCSTHHLIEAIKAETSGEAGRAALRAVFSALTKFPNLQNLRLDFHDQWQEDTTHEIPENPTHFLLLQNELFATLAANPPPPLMSLTLNNVLAVPDNIYAQEDFHRIFRPLQKLEISVLSAVDYEGSYFQDPLIEFWLDNIVHMIRSATAVTALTIRSDQDVGACPSLSFKDMSFPRLTSLALHQFVFEPGIPEVDVVAFILRHKTTLERLELHDCSIDGGEDGDFPRLWHAVFALFEAELSSLREFVFGPAGNEQNRDEDTFERDPRFEYTRLDPGGGICLGKRKSPPRTWTYLRWRL